MNTSSNIIQSATFNPESSFTELAGSSRNPGPPNYYNVLDGSVYPPNDGTGNVGSFTSVAGGNPFSFGSASENNAGVFVVHSDATSPHTVLGYDPRMSTNMNLFPTERVLIHHHQS